MTRRATPLQQRRDLAAETHGRFSEGGRGDQAAEENGAHHSQ
jgi:hypothetical protein